MDDEISLEKKAAIIDEILLDKGGIKKAPIMRVAAVFDISGSMDMQNRNPARDHIISSGKLQKAFNKMMGVSVAFDDNSELDVFKFDNYCEYVGTATPKDYTNYISRNGIKARGGTEYSPIVGSVRQFFFEQKTVKKGGFFGIGGRKEVQPVNDMPVLAMILTDGEPSEDYRTVERAFASVAHENIYFHLVGIGGSRADFPTIARIADDLDNVGEVYLPHFEMADQDIYEQLITDELIDWIKKHPSTTAASA